MIFYVELRFAGRADFHIELRLLVQLMSILGFALLAELFFTSSFVLMVFRCPSCKNRASSHP